MGTGFRVCFIDTDGSVVRIPYRKYDRLFKRDKNECMLRYAGQRIRCATFAISLINGKPDWIKHAWFSIIPFDARGRLDHKEFHRAKRLAVNSLDFPDLLRPDNVLDITHLLSRKQYKNDFTWYPAQEELRELIRVAFK